MEKGEETEIPEKTIGYAMSLALIIGPRRERVNYPLGENVLFEDGDRKRIGRPPRVGEASLRFRRPFLDRHDGVPAQ